MCTDIAYYEVLQSYQTTLLCLLTLICSYVVDVGYNSAGT